MVYKNVLNSNMVIICDTCRCMYILALRFSKLLEPATERRQQLEDSLKLQQFYREVEGEVQWVKEHKPLADSPDYGKSLTGVQNLQKKHQVLCIAIEQRETHYVNICSYSRYQTHCCWSVFFPRRKIT